MPKQECVGFIGKIESNEVGIAFDIEVVIYPLIIIKYQWRQRSRITAQSRPTGF